MRCYICNSVLAEPVYNADHEGYEPCTACLSVIEDTLAGYNDTPAAPEDAFGDQLELPIFVGDAENT